MGNRIIQSETLTSIANAIRAKTGRSASLTPAQMVTEIGTISGGGVTPTGTKQITITQNGTTTENVTNYASAEIIVNVPTGGGGGSDISPFKFVKGIITPSENTQALTFPCGDITTVVFFEAKVVDYDNYISTDNNGMGLGRVHYNYRPYFDNRAYNGSMGGNVLSVSNGALDYWNAPNIPTFDAANQTARFAGSVNATFKAGVPIEYVMWGM